MVSLAEGFGFNTNLLETNILNLAVVLPLVFSLGKDTLTSILDNRREKILSSLRSADDRFKQAQLELDAANFSAISQPVTPPLQPHEMSPVGSMFITCIFGM